MSSAALLVLEDELPDEQLPVPPLGASPGGQAEVEPRGTTAMRGEGEVKPDLVLLVVGAEGYGEAGPDLVLVVVGAEGDGEAGPDLVLLVVGAVGDEEAGPDFVLVVVGAEGDGLTVARLSC